MFIYDHETAGWEDKLYNDITSSAQLVDTSSKIWPHPLFPSAKTLIFDIDGTILSTETSFEDAQGKVVIEVLSKLIKRGFYIVFITGNDYNFQWRRILKPFIDTGIAEYSFVFSDGGTRAFEFNKSKNDFDEIKNYSNQNIIDQGEVDKITSIFESELELFISKHTTLLLPSFDWVNKSLDYVDIKVHRP